MEPNYAEELGVCKYCQAKNVRNPKTGKVFCSDKCWLKRGIGVGVTPQNPTTGQISPSGGYPDVSSRVKEAQDNKQESMRIFSSGRDSVLIVCAEMGQGNAWSEEDIKKRIEFWNTYLYSKIYVDTPLRGI